MWIIRSCAAVAADFQLPMKRVRAKMRHSVLREKLAKQVLSGLPDGSGSKESACQCRRCGFDPWVGKIPWRRKCQPIPVFLPGEFHGQGAWWAIVHGLTKSWTWLSRHQPQPERSSDCRVEMRHSEHRGKLASRSSAGQMFSGADFMSPILVSPHI